MRTIKTIFILSLIYSSQLLLSCFPDHTHKDLRIKTLVWENVRYTAEYTRWGLLSKLRAIDRTIAFHYDEDKHLYKADITFRGSSAPESVFTYMHGAEGITRIMWTRNGAVYRATDITYGPGGVITNIVSAFGVSTDPYDRHTLALTHQGDNVSKLVHSINGNDFTQMRTENFDTKINPFRLLAKSVNNAPFFPVGYYVFFQVGDYNIPYITWLSENNPLDFVYETVNGGPLYGTGLLIYTYKHDLVTKIVWGGASDPNIKTFEFDYALY